MNIILHNNVSKNDYEFQLNDIGDSSIYYHFNIILEDNMPDGEYEYRLYDEEDNIVAKGLLQIGDYTAEHTVYNENNKKKYIQYNG